jgi:hypothetical protein
MAAHLTVERKAPRRRRQRGQRGLLSNIGNMLLPGIGGQIGQIGDNLVGGFLGGKRGAPVNLENAAVSQQVNHSFENGTEKLQTVTVPAGTPPGSVLYQTFVTSSTLGPRMAAFSKLWDRTRYLRVAIEVQSSSPTTVAGSYIHAIDPDPVVPYESDGLLPSKLMALQTSKSQSAWAESVIELKPTASTYFNFFDGASASDAEYRQFAPGRYILATNATFDATVDLTIMVSWSVMFERPVLVDPNEQNVFFLTFPSDGSAIVNAPLGSPFGTVDNKSEYWMTGLPPPGTYSVDFNLDFRQMPGGAPWDRRISSVEVVNDDIFVLECEPFWSNDVDIVGAIQGTVPDPVVIKLQSPRTAGRIWLPPIKRGLSMVCPLIKPTNEFEWEQRCQKQQLRAAEENARKRALSRYHETLAFEQLMSTRTRSAPSPLPTVSSHPALNALFSPGSLPNAHE